MANEQNLISLKDRPQRERKEIARKGAEATNKLRAERKTLREELLILLEEKDYQEKISIAILEQAKKGNTKAYEIIRDTIGEKPKDNINISGEINNPYKELSLEELKKLAGE